MLPILQETLANGVRIVCDAGLKQESSAIGVWIDTGARYEQRKAKGVAHFAEHLLFKGSKHYTYRALKREIEGRGGMLNGFTSQEITCYYAKVLNTHVFLTLDILLDMVLSPLLLARDIEKERKVILEEIKMQNDLPQSRSEMLLDELLWGEAPLGCDISGTEGTVKAITRTDIVSFLKRHYTAPRLLITVCAKTAPRQIRRFVEDKCRVLARKRDHAPAFELSPVRTGVQVKVEKKDLFQTHCTFGFNACGRKDPLVWAFKLMHVILGANMSSRLFERVREERALAYDIATACRFYHDCGCFSVHTGLAPEHVLRTVKVILKELARMRQSPVGRKEFQRAQDFVLGQMVMAFERPMERMLYIGESLLGLGAIPSLGEVEEEIRGVSPRMLQRLAARVFSGKTLKVALVGNAEPALAPAIVHEAQRAGYHA